MQKIPFTKKLKEQHRKIYNPEKVLQEIEREIEEKGFSIFEVDEQKRLEFFYHFPKKFLKEDMNQFISKVLLIFLVIIVSIIYFLTALFLLLAGNIKGIIIFFVLVSILIFFIRVANIEKNKIKNSKLTGIPGIKNKYIIVTKYHIIINNKISKIELKDLKNYKSLFSHSRFYYKESYKGELKEYQKNLNKRNKTSRKITIIAQHLSELEESLTAINENQEKIKSELIKMQKGSFVSSKIQNYIKKFEAAIKKSMRKQLKVQNTLKKIDYKIPIDFSKFDIYMRNKLIFPLKSMKYIVSSHLFVIDYQNNSTKNLDSEHIQLANARLKTYKTQLEQQVELLEQQIEKLELKK